MPKTEGSVPSSLQSKYLQKFDGLTLSKSGSDDSDDDDGEPRRITFFIDSKPRVEPEAEEAPHKTRQKVKLASELNPGINLADTYVAARDAASKSAQKVRELMLESSADSLLKGSVLTPGFEKKDCVPPYSESMRQIKLRRKEERSKTKGPGWFGLPAPEMTDELKHDLEVLRMRHVLDPKRFYKKNDLKDLPKYFQFDDLFRRLVSQRSIDDSAYGVVGSRELGHDWVICIVDADTGEVQVELGAFVTRGTDVTVASEIPSQISNDVFVNELSSGCNMVIDGDEVYCCSPITNCIRELRQLAKPTIKFLEWFMAIEGFIAIFK
ncbi:hypothetical protein HPB49_011012 [Dermacentor silvarum]|uniref:Uncharacterized protein n=1 Tax=Dermacentor silvarum TaxID=543639 RepID=A0ACB8DZ42_DERSI|nr:hypothetical protein HPB49_011012 [Dermacentor silvarum]